MKFPWKKPREATAAELRADLERAKAEVLTAEADEAAAWSKFRESGGDGAASKAHDVAEAAANDARKQVARLVEDVPAAEAREVEAAHAKLRVRRDALRSQLTHDGVLTACASDHEAAVANLVAFANARMALARQGAKFRGLERELAGVLADLGESPLHGIVDDGSGESRLYSTPEYSTECYSPSPIADRLARLTAGLPTEHPLYVLERFVRESGPVRFAPIEVS